MLKDLENKKKIQLAITGIGIIILIYMVANNASRPKHITKPASEVAPNTTLELSMAASLKASLGDKVKWGRDPFLLDASKAKERGMEDLTLSGIVAGEQIPYAVINNEVVKLGDKVGVMTVIEINEDNVVLDENGQRHILELSTD